MKLAPPVFLLTLCELFRFLTGDSSEVHPLAFALGVASFLACFPRFYIGDHAFLRARKLLRRLAVSPKFAVAAPDRVTWSTRFLRGGQYGLFACQALMFMGLAYYASSPRQLCVIYVTLLCVNVAWLLVNVVDIANDLETTVYVLRRELLRATRASRVGLTRRLGISTSLNRLLLLFAVRWAMNNLAFIAVGTWLCLRLSEFGNSPIAVALLVLGNSAVDYYLCWGVYRRGFNRAVLAPV